MAAEPTKTKRRYMFGEARLLSEWAAATFPGRELHFQFRVGSDPAVVGAQALDEAERNLIRSFNRRVDLVVAPPPDLWVVEATMYNATEKVGRLQEYLLLLRATPEYARWGGYPTAAAIVTGQDDPVAKVLCTRLGFRYVFWEPSWIDDFYAIYPARRRRAPHAGMIDLLG